MEGGCFYVSIRKKIVLKVKKIADEIFELYMLLTKVKLILGSIAELLCLHVMTWHAAVDSL